MVYSKSVTLWPLGFVICLLLICGCNKMDSEFDTQRGTITQPIRYYVDCAIFNGVTSIDREDVESWNKEATEVCRNDRDGEGPEDVFVNVEFKLEESTYWEHFHVPECDPVMESMAEVARLEYGILFSPYDVVAVEEFNTGDEDYDKAVAYAVVPWETKYFGPEYDQVLLTLRLFGHQGFVVYSQKSGHTKYDSVYLHEIGHLAVLDDIYEDELGATGDFKKRVMYGKTDFIEEHTDIREFCIRNWNEREAFEENLDFTVQIYK